MSDDDRRPPARRAADDHETPREETRPRRHVTPDWDDDDSWDDDGWDGDGPDDEDEPDDAGPVRGARWLPTSPDEPEQTQARGARFHPDGGDATVVRPAARRGWHAEPAASSSDALGARESRAQEPPDETPTPPLAAGTRAGDDWRDAPIPGVSGSLIGQAPPPIEVVSGAVPHEHDAFVRPDAGGPRSAGRDRDVVSTAPGAAWEVETTKLPKISAAPEEVTLVPPPGVGPSVGSRDEPSPEPTSDQSPPDWPSLANASGPSRSAEPPQPRSRRTLWIGLAALIAVALIIGLVVFFTRRESGSTASTPSQQASAATLGTDDLVKAEDLAALGAASWQEQATDQTITADTQNPLCIAATQGLPTSTSGYQRKLGSGSGSVIHRAEGYATLADAQQYYVARQTQVGRCANVPIYLQSGAKITGLGDEAVAVTAIVQDQTPSFHTVVLARTGQVVNILDITQAGQPATYENAVSVAAAAVARECPRSGGACAQSPAVTAAPPPSGGVAGWLTVSDLPRITAGAGRWTASDPTTTIRVPGSACENLSFATVTGPTARKQRTYLLTEDPRVPKDFGVDELVLEFDTPEAAQGFANSLGQAIDGCPGRTPTAKLGASGPLQGTGANGEQIGGFWRTVTQATSATTSVVFRVSVAVVGTKVVYLLGTPTASYDFIDSDWAALGVRSGQRATQN